MDTQRLLGLAMKCEQLAVGQIELITVGGISQEVAGVCAARAADLFACAASLRACAVPMEGSPR